MHKLFSFGLAAAAVGLIVSSCGSTEVTCEDLATCPKADAGQGGGGSAGAAGNGGAGGAAGGDGSTGETGVDAGCTSMLPPGGSMCINEAIALLVSSRGNDATATGK